MNQLKKKNEPEKKYRPFSLNEFLNQYHLGDEINFASVLGRIGSLKALYINAYTNFERFLSGFEQ